MNVFRRMSCLCVVAVALAAALPAKRANACVEALSCAATLAAYGAALIVVGGVALVAKGIKSASEDDGPGRTTSAAPRTTGRNTADAGRTSRAAATEADPYCAAGVIAYCH